MNVLKNLNLSFFNGVVPNVNSIKKESPEELFEGALNTLSTITEKEALIVIFNIPLQEYLQD